MEQDLYFLASALTGEDESELKRQLEMLVRAYDPCISCLQDFADRSKELPDSDLMSSMEKILIRGLCRKPGATRCRRPSSWG